MMDGALRQPKQLKGHQAYMLRAEPLLIVMSVTPVSLVHSAKDEILIAGSVSASMIHRMRIRGLCIHLMAAGTAKRSAYVRGLLVVERTSHGWQKSLLAVAATLAKHVAENVTML
jgi:hypothetical protein